MAHSDPSVDDHAALVRSLLAALSTRTGESVALAEALGRVTAAAVLSPVDLPLFRNSQMDGFAVVSADLLELPVTLPIVAEIAARAGIPAPLLAGTVARIMTGAVLPEGADVVVPVEDTTSTRDHVTFTRRRSVGDFVRERASDLHAGDALLPSGQRLAARHLAVLAAAGLDRVTVNTLVAVAVITTGAELIPVGQEATIGQVFDANSVALVAAVTAAGASVVAEFRVTDDHTAMRLALQLAVSGAELVVTSGGISMGEYEVVREVLEPLGAAIGHIAMQPGGPQATTVVDGIPIISFPGNPVSTQISFEIFVAPILREIAALPPAVRCTRELATAVRSIQGKRQFLRGLLLSNGRVAVVGGPSSHLIAGLAASDLLIDLAAEISELNEGDTVETLAL